MKNKNVRQDDPLENLADALTEDILNTPDGELLREVEEDYGDPRALANKFDQILERAKKQVFATARPAAAPQVWSSVLDLPSRLGGGSRLCLVVAGRQPMPWFGQLPLLC